MDWITPVIDTDFSDCSFDRISLPSTVPIADTSPTDFFHFESSFLAQIFSGLVSLEILFWKFASIIPTPIKNYRSVRFRSTLTLKHVISLWFIRVFELDQIWHEIDFLPEASFPDRFRRTNQLNHSDQLWYNQFESSHRRFLSWISTVNHKTKNWWINTAFFVFFFF